MPQAAAQHSLAYNFRRRRKDAPAAAVRPATGAFLFSAAEFAAQNRFAPLRDCVPQHRISLPPARRRRVFYFTEPRPPSAEICLRHFASQSRRTLCRQKSGCRRARKSSIRQGCFPAQHQLRQRAPWGPGRMPRRNGKAKPCAFAGARRKRRGVSAFYKAGPGSPAYRPAGRP